MADNTKTASTVLEFKVDINKAYDEIAELNIKLDEQKEKVRELNEQYKDQGKTKEYYKELAKIKEQTKDYNDQVRSLTKSIENEKKANDQREGSLVALRGELSNLTKAYDQLSRAEREGAEGQELQKKIAKVYNELSKAEKETGRFQRNVGNYGMQMVTAFDKAGGAVGEVINPIKNATSALGVMSKTPVIAVLGLLARLINAVAKAFTGMESSMDKMNGIFGIFKGLGVESTRVMQRFAGVVAKAAEWLGKAAERLGLITDAMREQQEIGREQIELRNMEREALVQNAKDSLEVARLRNEAEDRTRFNEKQRLEMIQRANELEQGMADRELAIAQKRYEIAVRQAAQTENSTEANNALAEAEANLYKVREDYYNRTRRLKEKLSTLNASVAKGEKTAAAEVGETMDDTTKRAEEAYKRAIDIKTKELETRLKLVKGNTEAELIIEEDLLRARHEAEMHALELQEGTQNLRLLKEEEFQQNLAALRERYRQQEDDALQAEIDATLAQLEREQQAEERIEAERVKMHQASAAAIGAALGSLGDLAAAFGQENRELAKMAKVLAIAQIAVETGVATAKGIKSAQDVAFPGNLAAIASTVSAILSGMASAVSTVKGAKFAQGGLVSGPGSATSDSIPARLSDGEFIMNAASTAMFQPILSALNAAGQKTPGSDPGTGFAFIAEAVAAGMQSADLRVSVDEVGEVQARVDEIRQMAQV